METEDRLIEEVQAILRQRYQIVINIPPLKKFVPTTINLKYVGKTTTKENRYRVLIKKIEEIMIKKTFEQHEIDLFKRQFFSTIESDIKIMQENENIRFNSYKVRDKLLYRMSEIKKKQQEIIQTSDKIHDKEDILSFIAIDMKKYLTFINLLADDYETVKKIKVLTPINIDAIYHVQIATEQYYLQHYEPLLELLVRLKSNMNNLYQEVVSANKIDVPLKSINFLANCKNLLLEMEPFLMSNQCAFNNLIFHVTSCQEENMRLISSCYQNNLNFTRNLILNVYKCTYLGHIFEGYARDYKQRLSKSKSKMIKIIEQSPGNVVKAKTLIQSQKIQIKNLREEMRRQKMVICYGKTMIMKKYIEEKISKKLNILLEQKDELIQLEVLLERTKKYFKDCDKLKQYYEQYPVNEKQVVKDVEFLERDETLNEKINSLNNSQKMSNEEIKEKLFEKNFRLIENQILQIRQLQHNFTLYKNQTDIQPLSQKFFPQQIEQAELLLGQYFQLQTKLINKYEHLLREKENKEKDTDTIYEQTIGKVDRFLEREVQSGCGFQIINEDEKQSSVSSQLLKVDKVDYMVKNFVRNQEKHQKYSKQLLKRRKTLEILFTLFEGSLSDENFSIIMNVMDFDPEPKQITEKNKGKINEMLGVMSKYLRDLKKIQKQLKVRKKDPNDPKSQKSINKIHKIVRDRLIMYQLLQDLYTDSLTVNEELRKWMQKYNLETKGIRLFDRGVYDYCLTVYTCKQKLTLYEKQINDIEGMPSSTKNFILDELYEPYLNRVNEHVKYSNEQLLNIILNLESALKIQRQYINLTTKFQKAIYSSNFQNYFSNLKLVSEEMCVFYKNCKEVESIDGKEIVIHNMAEFREILKLIQQYNRLANRIVDAHSLSEIDTSLDPELTNEKVENCRRQLQIRLKA